MSVLYPAREIARITQGELRGTRNEAAPLEGVCIDSRKVEKGSLFVALPGTRTDGHEFLEQAAANGAAGLLVRRAWWRRRGERLERQGLCREAAVIAVDDPLEALQRLAAHHLLRFPAVTRVGVTGSNGKTTTKEIIGGILAQTAPTVKSRGNLNSEIGLPLVALGVTKDTRFAVFEMATNHPGEMEVLADIVRPNLALITNIGSAHIEFFGSREAIAEEKKQIFRFFGERDTGFLFEREPFFRHLAEGVQGEILPFGPESTTGYGGSRDLGLDGTAIDWEGLQIHFPLFGEHNLMNALGAVTLCRTVGVDREAVKAGLERVEPIFARSRVIRGPVTIVEDCYNANPDSMKTVLGYFDALGWDGRKLAVLGNMLELGDESRRAHVGIALLAVRLSLDRCVFYGEGWAAAAAVFEQPAAKARCVWTSDFDTLLHILSCSVEPGDLIVLKGSRGARLERLVDPLKRIAA